MKKTIAFSVFWLGLLLCSSRGTDLFHITADEQLAKFQDLFRSRYGGYDRKETAQYQPYIVADSEIIYQCNMTQKNTGARRKARIKVSMQNVYTDDYPDGIITCLYFTNVDQQNENLSPVSQ